MTNSLSAIGVALAVGIYAAASPEAVFAQAPRAPRRAAARSSPEKLPPLSYTCPMHPDVVEDKEGNCPICHMKLEPIRLVSVWTCPNQPGLGTQDKPGRCPTDGRPLVQMTMALTFTCADSKNEALSPGTCGDGSPMSRHYTLRPHGNHNPQHGGQFFMASDNWHHLEGTYLPSGVFRLYLYDDFTKPLPVAKVQPMQGRVILTKSAGAQATPNTSSGAQGAAEFPLVRNGRVLEAKVGKLPFPTELQTRIKFDATAPENLFDFAFESYSREVPAAAPKTTSVTPTAPPTAVAAPPTPAAAPPSPVAAPSAPVATPGSMTPAESVPSGVDPALLTSPVPDTVPEMLAQLRTRTDQIKELIDRGAFAAVYVPAFQAKDIALALDAHKTDLPEARQRGVGPAANRVVRGAYLLDAFGDLGNRQQIVEAYGDFAQAVKDIEAAFPSAGHP